jgi:hypothetical protein
LRHSPDIEHPASATNNPRVDNIAKRIVTSPDAEPRLPLRSGGGFLDRPPLSAWHVHLMGRGDRRLMIGVIDVRRRKDVVAVIDEMHLIESHALFCSADKALL